MKEAMFYNFNYNHLAPDGQLKFFWGIGFFDLSKAILPQLISASAHQADDMHNINLVAFNGLPNCEGVKQ